MLSRSWTRRAVLQAQIPNAISLNSRSANGSKTHHSKSDFPHPSLKVVTASSTSFSRMNAVPAIHLTILSSSLVSSFTSSASYSSTKSLNSSTFDSFSLPSRYSAKALTARAEEDGSLETKAGSRMERAEEG